MILCVPPALVAALQPPTPAAAPASYTVVLPGGNIQALKVLSPTQLDAGETTTTVESSDSGGLKIVVNAPHGKRYEATSTPTGFSIQELNTGELLLEAPLLTYHDTRLYLGRRYDWEKKGPQRFQYLGYTVGRPALDDVTLEAGGATTLRLERKPVRAMRLKYTIKQVLDGRTIRGEVLVGLSGELLSADPPFTSVPVRAKKPLQIAADGSLTVEYTSPAFTMHAKAGPLMMLTRRMKGAATGEFVLTDSDGHPVQVENDWPGLPFSAMIDGDSVKWSVKPEGGLHTVAVEKDALVLYPTRLFTTSDWETSLESVGAKKDAVLLMLKPTEGESCTVERLADVVGPNQIVAHRFRITGTAFRGELFTDGKQLLALRTPDDVQITRDGLAPWLKEIKPLEWLSVTITPAIR